MNQRRIWKVMLVVFMAIYFASAIARTSRGQIFVTNVFGTPQTLHGSVSEYNLDGTVISPALFTPGSPNRIAISGNDLYVLNGGGEFFGSVDKFTTFGGTTAVGLIPTLAFPRGLAVSGANLFISDANGVHKYDTSGQLIADSFTAAQFDTFGMAVSADGSRLLIAGDDSIGEYDAVTGATIDDTFITGLSSPFSICIAGAKIYVVNFGSGTVGEYAADGTPINAALVSGLDEPYDVADFGGKLFVVNSETNSVGEYDDATGATINANFITGLSEPLAIAVVPEPATWVLFTIGVVLLARAKRR